jgi:hypothetical protein
MAKTTDVTLTFPVAVTDFGTVTSWTVTSSGKHILGHDEDGEVDAEAYTERKWELDIEGEFEDGTDMLAVGGTFSLDVGDGNGAQTYTVDECDMGQSNDAVGTFSVKAHRFQNL